MTTMRFIIALTLLLSQISADEYPMFTVLPNALEESDLESLNQLTQTSTPKLQWYGRFTFWQEVFEAEQNDGGNMIYHHNRNSEFLPVIDKLTSIFLTQLQQLGIDISKKRIILESYLDRNIVPPEKMESSGMFWHRDAMLVDGIKKTADYTMILLMNGKNQDWEGADVILQKGGDYQGKGSYVWVNSDNPQVIVKPAYNQLIIFRNFDCGHMVTPLKPLHNQTVQRDVFITTCYFE